MATTVVQKIDRKVGKALNSFQKAFDALGQAESEALDEAAHVDFVVADVEATTQATIDDLRAAADARIRAETERKAALVATAERAAAVRAELGKFVGV